METTVGVAYDWCGAGFGVNRIHASVYRSGSTFDGWSGACSGIENCIVTIDENKSISVSLRILTQTMPKR